MTEGSGNKKKAATESFTDVMFSWSLEDILNENLFRNQVLKIPESFQSVQNYLGSYVFPLLEETRAQLSSSMENMCRAPFAEVIDFKSKPEARNIYHMKVDYWQNRFHNYGEEPYDILPGDIFVLADFKPETLSDLQRVGRSWAFISVSKVSENDARGNNTHYFTVKSSKEFEVNNVIHTSHFLIFLANMTHNGRIWKALQMCRNPKIIQEVLCTDSVVKKRYDLCTETKDDIPNEKLVNSLCSELNESQTRAVLACLHNLHCDADPSVELIWGPPGTGKTKTVTTLLFTLLRMGCRSLICAPTKVAIIEAASRFVKMLTDTKSNALFCSLGDILLFGDRERLKVGSGIQEIFLDYRVKRLARFLGSQDTGWRHCFDSMIRFLEDCVSHYQVIFKKELKEKEQKNSTDSDIKEKEGTSDTKGKCITFIQFLTDSFVCTASPLRDCISIFRTHLSTSYVSVQNSQNMSDLIALLDSFESLLNKGNVISEELEDVFSHPQVAEDLFLPEVAETIDYKTLLLCMRRSECLSVLRDIQDSLAELNLPDDLNEGSLKEFCFQSASVIFCTVSSSYKLHRVPMEPPTILVIDEAAQVKECESAIPLQLQGIKHAILVGDEYQLPATVKSNASDGAGFARSLFKRLSCLGHSKHLLDMQYRMHPSISFFPNSKFYCNQILDAPNVKGRRYEKRYLPGSIFGPYSFINVIGGREVKEDYEHTRKNMVEVALVSKIVRNLFKEWISSERKLSIGVASPYAAQVAAIQDKIGNRYENVDGFIVKVKIVDDFQGGEEDIIIMSTVRSNFHPSQDFIWTPQRINVALTRARHCLWILGNERTLCNSESVWESLVLDAKNRQCFFNADDHKDFAKTILAVKKAYDEFDDLLNADSILFRNARWKVHFSDNFLRSFRNLISIEMKKSVLNLLLKVSSGWRPKNRNVDTVCESSSMILKQFKAEGLYIACTIDIKKDFRYVQVLKIWDMLHDLFDFQKLENSLDNIFRGYTSHFISRCNMKCLENDLEVPMSWPLSSYIARFNDETGTSYVENSKVSESLLLMKFYSLSSGIVNHLLSDRDGRKSDLPFEVTEKEMDIIVHNRSTFILGRSGTGKTTVLVMKILQKEQQHHMATEGFCAVQRNLCSRANIQNNDVDLRTADTKETVLRQIFVTVSPKLCFATREHVLRLKSFACGGMRSDESSLNGMHDIDEEEAQFKDIPDSFVDIPPKCFPLFITFDKFLMMLDGALSNSYFDKFLNSKNSFCDQLPSSRSVLLQTFLRTKEVKYEKFSSSYWPRFNTQSTKKLDPSSVYTEIISHIKGSLGAIETGNGILSREDYLLLSHGRDSYLSMQMREIIYDIFQVYEKMKVQNGEFDLADFVTDLHLRLRREKYRGDEMNFVYIDEVQDLTMSQISLFKHICRNVEEGFVFSGDTAQTIARGVNFRFQDIRHLFYKKFFLESSSNKHHGRKDKGRISELFQLSENFRTHAGILRLSHSIIELLYNLFPLYIDILKPETCLINGEAPVLLQYGCNEDAIEKVFGNRGTGSGSFCGFGADQVILVRDDSARKEISDIVGKKALVLTIMECKGLEFQDVLLHNFFGSSPLKDEWRLIYGYMDKQDLLDSSLPKGFPSFNEAKHRILCLELKQLYVAVTRTRQRLWISENTEEHSKPMFDYWKKKRLVQVWRLDDFSARSMQVRSSLEDWKARGMKLYNEHNYEMAQLCFDKAGETYWERRCKAAGLKAMADRMRASNPRVANSSLREAAEIFEDIGNADTAARCFSDLGEYERAGRIYLEKCGKSALERAAECFSLAGCYEIAADVYATGNFFFACLNACVQGKLFDVGLKYIKQWEHLSDRHEDCAMAKREAGADKVEQRFLERAAFHYYQVKDNVSMMRFVKAFQSVDLMRNCLKKLGSLDELLLFEQESGNYLESAKIAKLKGDILLVADFLEKAGRFREASLHILFYVLANSLWSSGRKGWPIRQFPEKEGLLTKAKLCANNEGNSFYEFVCIEADILLDQHTDLAVIKSLMNASERHKCIRGEMLCARKLLDAHLSSGCTEYLWEEELNGDLNAHAEDKLSKNQVTCDSLIYFWNFWKDKMVHIIQYVGFLETQEVNEYRSYGELCLNYLGVWRQYHNLNPIHLLLIRDSDWVRGVERTHFQSYGKLVSIDVHELVSAARIYWTSEMLSVGIKVLDKLEALYGFLIKKYDSLFCQSRSLNQIYEVAMYLLQSKCLNRRYQDTVRLQKFVKLSTENVVACIFPLDWRKSLRGNMIYLRQTAAFKNFLEQVIVEYISSSKKRLSYGQLGTLAMVMLGSSGKLYNEQHVELVKTLGCSPTWRAFIENLCGIALEHKEGSLPGTRSQEPIEVSLVCWFHEALFETCNTNRSLNDYISPGCFLYLVERLLVCVCCFQGYVITTKSCFIEWLVYQEENTNSRSSLVFDVQQCFGDIPEFLIDVVEKFLYSKEHTTEWIKRSYRDWENCYTLVVLRLVVVLCLLYLNFGICLEMLFDLRGRSYITEHLPWEFRDALRRLDPNSLGKNVHVLAAVFNKIENALVIASFGVDCSRFSSSDAIFVDMKANDGTSGILRKLFQ